MKNGIGRFSAVCWIAKLAVYGHGAGEALISREDHQ
jgi:hypothetical protein